MLFCDISQYPIQGCILVQSRLQLMHVKIGKLNKSQNNHKDI